MIELSRSQERDERGRLGRGLAIAFAAAPFCLSPLFDFPASLLGLIGALLAAIGYVRVSSSITRRHRFRKFVYLMFALATLIAVTGALLFGLYRHVQDPNAAAEARGRLIFRLTGREATSANPDGRNEYGGYDYGTEGGMGVDPSLYKGFGEDGDQGGWGDGDDGWEGEDGDEGDQGVGFGKG